ncbi:MAG: hypothetical protein HYX53_10235 [Chloroflexi bacterium]|nr:hypothetical protein [Chloroflexota bacterium]
MAANESVQKYYDALLASYDILTEAVSNANERGMKVSKQFVSDIAKGQREAIELGKKLAAEPTDLGQYFSSMMEATTAAQGRALAFTQVVYQEAAAAGSDARETVQKLVEANKETAQAAIELTRRFAASNPMTEAVRRSVEAMTPPKEKAAAPKKETAGV